MISQADVDEWVIMQKQLKQLRAKEMMLRKQIVSAITGDNTIGTITCELMGYELKATNKLTHSIDKPLFNEYASDGVFTEEELEAVKLVPTLIVKYYEKLDPQTLLRSEVVTVKAAAPTLAVL